MGKIVFRDICKYYKKGRTEFTALNNISLDVDEGDFISIIGESGSGKTTILKIIMGLEFPDSGVLSIDDKSWILMSEKEKKKFRKNIQAVFQDSSGTLNPSISTYKNVEEALKNLTDFTKDERKKIIYELMELLNLKQDLLEVKPRNLSGGEQRRLALLRAISIRPKYLILDEVFSGLDVLSRDRVIALLELIKQNINMTVIMSTHDVYCAKRLSNKIIEIKGGEIINIAKKNNNDIKNSYL